MTRRPRTPKPLSAKQLAYLRSDEGDQARHRLAAVLDALTTRGGFPDRRDYPWKLVTYLNDIYALRQLGCLTGRLRDTVEVTGLTLTDALDTNTLDDVTATR